MTFTPTPEQQDWFRQHPEYETTGRPQVGRAYTDSGTLYADGRFEIGRAMKVVRLEPGCVLVGIRVPVRNFP